MISAISRPTSLPAREVISHSPSFVPYPSFLPSDINLVPLHLWIGATSLVVGAPLFGICKLHCFSMGLRVSVFGIHSRWATGRVKSGRPTRLNPARSDSLITVVGPDL